MNELNKIKKRLGKECTFLAFEKVKDRLFFKAKIGKDRIRIQINCGLEEVSEKEYDDLFKILSIKSYERGEGNI